MSSKVRVYESIEVLKPVSKDIWIVDGPLINFESRFVNSGFLRALMRLAGILDPDGKLPIDLRLSYWGRHRELKNAVDTMLAWNPERVIIAHGRWYETNGEAELRRAFRWVQSK